MFTPHTCNTLATVTPSDTTTLYSPTANPSHYQPNDPKAFRNSAISTPVASSSDYQYGFPGFPFHAFGRQPRYDLRTREPNISPNSTSTRALSISQPSLSEFRPHVADPLPSHSVSCKILDHLKDRDFEKGSLYIFDRASSPGHVKIGWTASSVSGRLEDWSKCGYSPNLLFSTHRVPHAQRVETLTHHELIKNWRRERRCKASWCGKSHQEWFEISKERAAQVLGDWADFMKRAEPYDSVGLLKAQWRATVEMMAGNGEVVTAKRLLQHYEESLFEKATLVKKPAHLTMPIKKDLLSEQILLPHSPLFQPTRLRQDTLSSRDKKPSPRIKTEETSAISVITIPDTNVTVSNLSSNSKNNSPVSLSAPASPSALSSRNIPPQTNGHGSNDTSISTNSPPLSLDASSETHPSDSSATSASIRAKAELVHNLLAPPVTDVKEALLPPSTDEEGKSAETSTSIKQRQQNVEGEGQAEPERALLGSDGQTCEEAIQSHDQDKSTATEKETGTETDGWDAKARLAEDQTSTSVEKAALKIVGELSKENFAGKANGTMKGLDGRKTLESAVPPAIDVVVQA